MTREELQELEQLTPQDLAMILRDQKHLYEAAELAQIEALYQQKLDAGKVGSLPPAVESPDAVMPEEVEDEDEEGLLPFSNEFPEVMTTSGYHFEGFAVTRHLGFMSCEEVLGTGFASELAAAFSDTFGTRSGKMMNKLALAKNAAFNRLVRRCLELSANAVLGITLNLMALSNNMIAVSASGTAVFVEKLPAKDPS